MILSVERNETLYHIKQLEDSKIFPAHWNVKFAIYSEHEKSRMKEATNELTNLISSLNLGSEEMSRRIRAIGMRGNC